MSPGKFRRYAPILFPLLIMLLVFGLVSPVSAAENLAFQLEGWLVGGRMGLPGEQVVWVITLLNTGIAPETNILILDSVAPELRIDDVTASVGQVSVTGQTVAIALAELRPGDSQQVMLTTTILASPEEGVLENAAEIEGRGLSAATSVQVARVLALPATGQTPWWRFWLLLIAGIALVIATVTGLVHLDQVSQ